MTAEQVLRALAQAIIDYRLRGEKDFAPVNEVLLDADLVLFPVHRLGDPPRL